jgi:golgi to ER traffic protein 4
MELIDLLHDGAAKLIAAKQFQSGSDLSLLLVEVLQKCKLDDQQFEKWIVNVAGLIEKIEPNVVEREALIVRAVKWSCEGNKTNPHQGHPLIHKLIANIMAKEQNYEQARYHYLLSKDGVGCAKILIQLSAKAFKTEVDLVIVQVVLNLLVLKEKDTALVTFNTYTTLHPQIRTKQPPYRTPLLNFLYFLLNIIEEPKLQCFKTLCELYKTALSRDPAYEKQLQQIGISYFGAPPARQARNNGLFGDLFSQLFQELEEDSDEDESQPAASSSSQFRSHVDLD